MRHVLHAVGSHSAHSVLLSLLVLLAPAFPAAAQEADVGTIIQKMKDAFEPARPSVRDLKISVSAMGETVEWSARRFDKPGPAGKRQLFVLLAPAEVRGLALLLQERKGTADEQWVYVPAVRRVRKVGPVNSFESFLNTDFTYYDMGFVDLDDRKFTMVGDTKDGGADAYQVQEVPLNPYYYSRVVTTIAKDTFLPVRRDYFSGSGALWKVERFDHRAAIDGVPTVLNIRIEDVLEKTGSAMVATNVSFSAAVPDDLFDPGKLSKVLDHSFVEPKGGAAKE